MNRRKPMEPLLNFYKIQIYEDTCFHTFRSMSDLSHWLVPPRNASDIIGQQSSNNARNKFSPIPVSCEFFACRTCAAYKWRRTNFELIKMSGGSYGPGNTSHPEAGTCVPGLADAPSKTRKSGEIQDKPNHRFHEARKFFGLHATARLNWVIRSGRGLERPTLRVVIIAIP